MLASAVAQLFAKHSPLERRLAHICALSGEPVSLRELTTLATASGWNTGSRTRLTQVEVKKAVDKLVRKSVLESSYYGISIKEDLQDWVVQDSIRDESFDALSQCIQTRFPTAEYGSARDKRTARDWRIAFYRGDVDDFLSLDRSVRDAPAPLLDPFDHQLYTALDPQLREMYLTDVLPAVIEYGECDPHVVTVFQDSIESRAKLSDSLIACAIDVCVASGRLDSLRGLDERTGKKRLEIAGCEAMLLGDYERAESCFAAAIPIGKRSGKKSKTAANHLPAVLYLLLLLKNNSGSSRKLAFALIRSLEKKDHFRYESVLDVFDAALEFQRAPSSPADFAAHLKELADSALPIVIVGYAWNWCLTEDDAKFNLSGLLGTATSYERMGLSWLAAEAAGLGGKSSLKSAARLAEKCRQTHQKHGTHSLIDAVRPAPVWERALLAIGQLAEGGAVTEAGEHAERMIWEISYSTKQNLIDLRPIIQKRNASGWTKGRPVSLERLNEEFNTPKFSFLTEADRNVCCCLQAETERNYYGYSETSYDFDCLKAAHALVGHSSVFVEGDRENPIEIVEREPHLVVTKVKGDRITISLDPSPKGKDTDLEQDQFQMIEEGPRRLSIVFFKPEHFTLNQILGGKLTVPKAAMDRVTESIQSVASLVSVHSEVGIGGSGETVTAESHPHLHILPHHAGLQLKFFVRPFGDEGPFFVPGVGAETVVAMIGDQTRSARRDLAKERRQQSAVVKACPTIAADGGGEQEMYFPTAADALETLLELEDLLAKKKITLHWPQGRCLQLAGQAAGNQFRVNIRKDRDWFAASGELKVDKSLSVDLMKLIDLVEASPSRFVQLDDGRFLALTEKLRRRIDDLSAYGDRGKDKLRFPPIRVAALEDLDEAISLKVDKHWRQRVERLHEAESIRCDTPSTLLADLRDYQQEGFQWLTRLAHWGAGACLADDMGLGKTIQALALLLQRSGDGPALVVAPTSVAFNWQNEIHRFAPTLNAQLFGAGDRNAVLKNLGPRDVLICSYGLLYSEAELLQSRSWQTVILDEAQAIKNVATKRSKAAMSLEAGFRLVMTGTPLENHLGELWNLFQFINPGLLGSQESFRSRFAAPIEVDGCRESRRRLKKLIQPFILRRTKSQVLEELPSRTEITLKVELSTEEASFYEALRQRAVEKLAKADDDQPQHLQVLAELMRLRRACCHPRLVMSDCGISSAKLALFSETIEELLLNRHKVLVFSQFVDHLTVLREELDRMQVSYQYLDGKTPAKQRKQRVEAFQSGEGDVFLISLKAGGLGLNLTAADYVLHMDPWWNPAVEDQASDRAHRLGQQRPVTIYRFITSGTIEERITDMHASKRDLADSLLQGTDMTGKLSAEELLKLIRE